MSGHRDDQCTLPGFWFDQLQALSDDGLRSFADNNRARAKQRKWSQADKDFWAWRATGAEMILQSRAAAAKGVDTGQAYIWECGSCGAFHEAEYEGDCRDDAQRFSDADDYAQRKGLPESSVCEVRLEFHEDGTSSHVADDGALVVDYDSNGIEVSAGIGNDRDY